MKYQLINQYDNQPSTLELIFMNRGIKQNEIQDYINTTDEDINSPLLLGEENLKSAVAILFKAVKNSEQAIIIVDPDADGFTASATLINYLHNICPSWIENNLQLYFHTGKQHGLDDCIDYILENNFSLVLIPDAGSNDYEQHKLLKERGIPAIVFDHHEAEKISEDAIIINNQLSDYPNKFLSGVGITWQFCRYVDKIINKSYADQYLDLVALGNCADMMSLTSKETKHIINKGFKQINNPFIKYMADKNSYSLGDKVTSMGAAFYIVPFINAIVRSGTQEEKILIFNSMLEYKAYNKIPSNKRGHKLGEEEELVVQAIRTAINVKNRQTKEQDASMEFIESRIEKDNMLEHKVLLFLLEGGEVKKNLAGLVANKIMAKYQHPCCILTKAASVPDESIPPWEDQPTTISYQGSARGCDIAGVSEFKDICENTGCISWAFGHQGAFGLSLPADNIDKFVAATDEALKDMSSQPIYYVDCIYDGDNINPNDILEIAQLDDFWGKDFDEPYIAIKDLKITANMVTIYRKTTNTIKISLSNNIDLIMFKASEDDCDIFQTTNTGYTKVDIIGQCRINEWNGNVSPQIEIIDYNIVTSSKYDF